MSSTYTGRKAEAAAAVYLEMRGYKIIEQNFRRPRCEIDIVASKDNTIYFVEVKYRRTNDQGGGFEAITTSKLNQMRFAAEIWVQETKWRGPYRLAAIELSGPEFSVLGFIDDVYF
jgi:putative endonuclease